MQARDQRRSHQEPRLSRVVPPPGSGHCRITLDPAPESTRAARDFTIAVLRGWYLDALIDDTVLVVSELVTNAIRHGTPGAGDDAARAPVELSWKCQASRLICTVTDLSLMPPVLGPADPDAESGRGLQVVQALAVAWGWMTAENGGKSVWAAFQIPGGRGSADRDPLRNQFWDLAQ